MEEMDVDYTAAVLSRICLVIDVDGFEVEKKGFLVRELGYASLTDENVYGSFRFNLHPLKASLTRKDWGTITFVKKNVHGLTFAPLPNEKDCLPLNLLAQKVLQVYKKCCTSERTLIAFKGGHYERDILTPLGIDYIDIEKLGCPKYKHLLNIVSSCGYHRFKFDHFHCPIQESCAFRAWIQENKI